MAVKGIGHAIVWSILSRALAAAPTNVPVKSSGNVTVGTQSDTGFNTNLYHDGTVSATANGYTMQIFMDSATENSAGNLTSFVSNSVSYVGLFGDPTQLYTFGGSGEQGQMTFTYTPSLWPVRDNETGLTAFWPAGAATVLPDNMTVLLFTDVVERTPPNSASQIYNTLVTVQAVSPGSVAPAGLPPTDRPSADDTYYGFWFANEPAFGSFASLVNDEADFLYVFAADTTGVKMARAPIDQYTSRSAYEYYDPASSSYSAQTPAKDDSAANMFDFDSNSAGGSIDSGSIYWNAYYNTYIAVMMNNNFDRRIWSSYSTTGSLEGPWAQVDYNNVLFTPAVDTRCEGEANDSGPYAFHGFTGYDPSGQTLLVAASGCAMYTKADLIQFV